MLNGCPIPRDALGRLVTINIGVIVHFNGGTPMGSIGDLQIVVPGSGVVRHGGLLYDGEGHLCVDPAGAIANHVQGGLPVTAAGALAIENAGVPAAWVASIPISATGRVCAVGAVTPTNFFAFSNAFSTAFDTEAAP